MFEDRARIVYTMKEVVWAAIFLFLIMYVFSLALTQGPWTLRDHVRICNCLHNLHRNAVYSQTI